MKPLFFRGGNIGKLAICGTINDLVTAGAKIVTGDTKVVERGNADGLFIDTSGIGMV